MKVSANIRRAVALVVAIGLIKDGVNADDVIKHSNGLLRSIYDDYMAAQGGADGGNSTDVEGSSAWNDFLVWKTAENAPSKLLVEVTAQGKDAQSLLQPAFEAYGFKSTGCSTYQCSGFLPIENFPGFEVRPEVREVHPSLVMRNQAGSKVSEAVKSLGVDKVREADPLLTGAGLKIGVLSDSFNRLGGYAADVASKDLPPNVVVLKELGVPGADEGRAMAQLIHDIAPGAQIYFYTAFEGPQPFAIGIQKLADAGCNVIVDDIIYFQQPFFQDGVIAQSANDVAELRGVPYFSAAGNFAARSWEGTFKGSQTFDAKGCERHNFGTGVTNTRQKITTRNSNTLLIFQWDNPFFSVSGPPGVTRDLDIRLYKDGSLFAASAADNIGLDPVEAVTTGAPGTYELEISLCTPGAASPQMKWMGFLGTFSAIEFGTNSSTCFGHPNGKFTAGVGAANFPDTPAFNGGLPPVLASYSSRGGTPIYFDRTGARLAEPEDRMQPRFVATDKVITTFFNEFLNIPPNGPGFYFSGTSAAAPNAAAVAILMLQINPRLNQINPRLKPLEVYDILAKTAIEMGPAGFDRDSGAGYIDANAAVNTVKLATLAPTIAPTSGPTEVPTGNSTAAPTSEPTSAPTGVPTSAPTPATLTTAPTVAPTTTPTQAPTVATTSVPTVAPTGIPTAAPTSAPTPATSTGVPTTTAPTGAPTTAPTQAPTVATTSVPTVAPTGIPTAAPTSEPTSAPVQVVPSKSEKKARSSKSPKSKSEKKAKSPKAEKKTKAPKPEKKTKAPKPPKTSKRMLLRRSSQNTEIPE